MVYGVLLNSVQQRRLLGFHRLRYYKHWLAVNQDWANVPLHHRGLMLRFPLADVASPPSKPDYPAFFYQCFVGSPLLRPGEIPCTKVCEARQRIVFLCSWGLQYISGTAKALSTLLPLQHRTLFLVAPAVAVVAVCGILKNAQMRLGRSEKKNLYTVFLLYK